MFAALNKVFRKKTPQVESDGTITAINLEKMSLDERKAYRLKMAKHTIEDIFAACEIIRGMYRYRILPLDDRNHYFAATVETTKHFALSKHIGSKKLSQIEDMVKQRAFDAYGIIIDGVYWKANETLEVFDTLAKRELAMPSTRPIRSIEEIAADFSDTVVLPLTNSNDKRYNRYVGDKEYNTDIMPLGDH